jgi:DnaJ-class molecular chaperone
MDVKNTTTDQLLAFIGLFRPTTMQALKTAYKRKSRELHPDINLSVDAEENFKLLNSIYETICKRTNWCMDEPGSNTPDWINTCGKGLGPNKNGRPCENCRGAGYTVSTYIDVFNLGSECPKCAGSGYQLCSKCNGTGNYTVQCNKCDSNGLFTLRSGRKVQCKVCSGYKTRVIGTCYTCNGTGRSKQLHHSCKLCGGDGIIYSEKESYSKCHKCNGVGEVEIWNPVIPKGRLHAIK